VKLKDSKNIQFINSLIDFDISGKVDGILVQDSKPDRGNWYRIKMKFMEGTFSNVSIINSKDISAQFYKVNLSNLLIKDSAVYGLKFEVSDISGDNRIENSKISSTLYGKTKVRNLTITNCRFEYYIGVILSEFIGLKLNNNTYESAIEYGVWNEKYTDSDKFPLKSTVIPEDKVPDEYFDIK